MLPAFPNVTTQIELDNNDINLEDLKSSVLSNKLVMLKWIQATEKQLKNEIKKTKNKILTESKREINYVDEILKEKLTIESKSTKNHLNKLCSFDECKRTHLPYSNFCTEHISLNKDQQLFKRCSVKLSSNQQCSNSSIVNSEMEICQKHSLKENSNNHNNNNQDSKQQAPKRKYTKTPNDKRKPRKKKEDKNVITIKADFNDNNQKTSPPESFTPFTTVYPPNTINNINNDLDKNNYAFDTNSINHQDQQHNLIDYTPCVTDQHNNLNQLSNHSEDLLVAIVNNSDDLTSIPLEESELHEMLGRIGNISDDAFNDLFMDNLSNGSSELRAIDNVEFGSSTDVSKLEPSISNQTFANTLDFKNSSTYFASDALVYTNGQPQANVIELSNLNNGDLNHFNISTTTTVQSASNNDQLNFGNNTNEICTIQNGTYGSYPVVLDYKSMNSIQTTSYSSNLVHHNYTNSATAAAATNFNSTTYLDNYSPSNHLNGNHSTNQTSNSIHSNGHNFNVTTNNLIMNGNYNDQSTNLNSLPTNNHPVSTTTNPTYLHCSVSAVKNDAHLDKKFDIFSGCKNDGKSHHHSSTYSNIYDDLPSFEANRTVNGTPSSSLPSFSIMRKNHIESR